MTLPMRSVRISDVEELVQQNDGENRFQHLVFIEENVRETDSNTSRKEPSYI